MTQLPLPAFARGSDTSKGAAASMRKAAPIMRAKVLWYVEKCGARGATCDEIEMVLEMRHQSASARVNELMNKGEIVDCGKRATRSGRNATVWCCARARAKR